jgi:hypothetical protein
MDARHAFMRVGGCAPSLAMEAKIGTATDVAAALREQAHEWKTVIEAAGVEGE